MEQNEEIKNLYRQLRHENFTMDGSDDGSCILHKKSPLAVELPSALVQGATTHVNMMACLYEVQTPEEVIECMQSIIQQRDYLRERGYQSSERFEVYDDGVEYVYDIPTESQDDLVRILIDLGECGNLSQKIQ